MHHRIIEDPKILESFPEFEPLFSIRPPGLICTTCAKNAYDRELREAYTKVLDATGITESDLLLYFANEFAKPKVTPSAVLNYANSLLNRVPTLLKGESLHVDEITRLERLAICRACPHLKEGVCQDCGCPVHKKTKPVTESCRLGRWS